MKYMFASDIHGSAEYADKVVNIFKESGARKLILCGDLLYHGPRNDLPDRYDTKTVYALLNELKDDIIAVRGNCDSEVDQMVLEFPMMDTFAKLRLNDIPFFVTHGHIYDPTHLPENLEKGSAFVFGHIHLPVAEKQHGIYIFNPGSTSIPKGGNPGSYAMLDERTFTIYGFAGNVIRQLTIQ